MTKVRFGVIGAGGIARRKTIPGMMAAPNLQLEAVMDVAKIGEIAAQFGVGKAYGTVEQLLADPAIQAVYIASPVYLHLEQIKACAAAGKHILCEKPLTLTSAEAKEAVAVCRRQKVFLQEGYMMKFHGAHQAIKRLIDEGRLGKITYIRAQLSCWYPPMVGAWRQDPAQGGGGSLIDMATHLYDLLDYFAGPIRRVVAFTGNLVQDYRSEDAATTLLELADGGHATVDTFFCVPDEASRTRLEVYGSQGSIFSEGTIGQSQGGQMEGIFGLGNAAYDATQSKDVARCFQPLPFAAVNPYTAECAYFADCILKGTAPAINGGENAVRIMQLTEKAYASARDGRARKV
jgi:predicted dehydrogenase